ncbi:hypothetical protein HYPSUDRAFT_136646 [Hypholoma sublateritium FD-334 SS-4]|uniref:Nascent polypeptide-associated complex subunit alpha-like UBA domain-containing protein n=1 Tax=Hypholoma sublateritium (strain FD-334 SS-4) TaxID=945553 RepID=A0A0D2MKN6_HYPSF|nr:hypothetical protein HYPSUDRAFT_136646 [Hypholoma sublateritium FD-334 SS-4]
MSLSNGRPEPEVIVNYADGFAYSKHKMEEAFRPGGFLEKVAPKPPAASRDPLKREDVDLIVHEFEISRAQAEKVLSENGSDVVKALNALITAPSNVSS